MAINVWVTLAVANPQKKEKICYLWGAVKASFLLKEHHETATEKNTII